MKNFSDYALKVLMILMAIIVLPVFACAETSDTIKVLSIDGKVIDKAAFILRENGSLFFVTAFTDSTFAQAQ